jgi:hypothetical protein
MVSLRVVVSVYFDFRTPDLLGIVVTLIGPLMVVLTDDMSELGWAYFFGFRMA